MIMNTAKLLFSLIVFPILVTGQVLNIDDMVIYDQKILDKFYTSTTYIVLDQHIESAYSKKLSESAKEFWTITPFEIIDRATYNTYLKDKTKSFLTREFIAGDKDMISLSLFMGGQKYMEKNGQLMANIKLKHYTATDEEFLFKLPVLLQNIQWRIKMIRESKFTGERDFQSYYLKNKNILHDKKLFILNSYLTNKVENLEEIKKFYKYDVSLVNEDVLADAILTQDTTIAFLSIVAPTKNWGGQTGYYRIYTTDRGETVLSYERAVSNTAPKGVTGHDLKTFNK